MCFGVEKYILIAWSIHLNITWPSDPELSVNRTTHRDADRNVTNCFFSLTVSVLFFRLNEQNTARKKTYSLLRFKLQTLHSSLPRNFHSPECLFLWNCVQGFAYLFRYFLVLLMVLSDWLLETVVISDWMLGTILNRDWLLWTGVPGDWLFND